MHADKAPQMETIVSFPLLHGTSTHYVDNFCKGENPRSWPYRDQALDLLYKTLERMDAVGVEVEFYERSTLEQRSEQYNAQHGQIYLSPNPSRAKDYARSGAAHGGERLSLCMLAIKRLREHDREGARALVQEAYSLKQFIDGGGPSDAGGFRGSAAK